MKKILIFLFCCLIPSLNSAYASSEHFLKETAYRQKVRNDFNKKKELLGNLFTIFNHKMTLEEQEAMMFLYAYMTPGDIADYSGEFYLKNVRLAFQSRKQTLWGAHIPEQIFRHFVLPVRVNNENLDNSREIFHKELMPRIKKLSMYNAVLEINHWCHEKVIYAPTDSRTSSPLATIKTAYGRCGEESTFLVAALRSVGIPARQVYTPRWAHTDDNHAWVEAWVDGKWYFLGACEPEPVLNLGWFNAPASRGMLMHTKVFGTYNGPEEIMKTTANYTEINIINNYAQSAPITVTVVDSSGKAVKGAQVEFKLYNYAEFYTVANKTTDTTGKVSLSAGLGDMLIYASDNQKFGLRKISFGKENEVTLSLSHSVGDSFTDTFHIVPPIEKANIPEVSEIQRKENTLRMTQEDSIRNAYISNFPTEKEAKKFARKLKLDEEKTSLYILKSKGNYRDIMQFLSHATENKKGLRALDLLSTLTEKDLHDTSCKILENHLYATNINADIKEVLAPRIANEMLTPYRSFLQNIFPAQLTAQIKSNPQILVKWCMDSLCIRNDLNTLFTITSPEGVWRSRVTDSMSRDVFFVAVARSLGIPAWKDKINGNVFYRLNGTPILVDFLSSKGKSLSQGILKATYHPIPRLESPEYYTHFTLSKYNNGTFCLQNYPEKTNWHTLLKNGSRMEAGYYMLVTGSRMANGSVLSQVSCFTLPKNQTTVINLRMLDDTEDIRVIGNFDSEALYTLPNTTDSVSILNTTGRGYYIIGVLGVNQEPTNHALKDIEIKKSNFEEWGRTLILLFTDEAAYRKFNRNEFPNLPSNTILGIDKDSRILKMISENMKLGNKPPLPIFILGDTFNRVLFESHGYTIGMGEQLLRIIHGL